MLMQRSYSRSRLPGKTCLYQVFTIGKFILQAILDVVPAIFFAHFRIQGYKMHYDEIKWAVMILNEIRFDLYGKIVTSIIKSSNIPVVAPPLVSVCNI